MNLGPKLFVQSLRCIIDCNLSVALMNVPFYRAEKEKSHYSLQRIKDIQK